MERWIFSPPVVFLLVLVFSFIFSALCSRLAFKSKKEKTAGSRESYACGENIYDNMLQPDYSQFFPFAFFFTILHVAVLIISTVPAQTLETAIMAFIYIIVLIIGLFTLFWR